MKDGGYYEGAFENGEIEGQGYRVFGVTGSTYTGNIYHISLKYINVNNL